MIPDTFNRDQDIFFAFLLDTPIPVLARRYGLGSAAVERVIRTHNTGAALTIARVSQEESELRFGRVKA